MNKISWTWAGLEETVTKQFVGFLLLKNMAQFQLFTAFLLALLFIVGFPLGNVNDKKS